METQNCVCSKQGCWRDDEVKIAKYCQANKFLDEIEASRGEYQKTGNIGIYEAACVVGAENDGFRPRIEEALHFSKHLNFAHSEGPDIMSWSSS